jgi:hypothetical protein
MAGDWIKMRGGLPRNPKVIRMARVLLQQAAFREWFGVPCDALRDVTRDVTQRDDATAGVTARDARLVPVVTMVTVGALLATWSSVNENASDDATMRDATLFEIDTIAGVPGFGEALAAVGWVEVLPNEEGLFFPNFHEYNTVGRQRSAGAKTGAERSKDYRDRKRHKSVTSRDVTPPVTRDHREEKRGEERKTPPNPPAGGGSGADSAERQKAEAVCKAVKAQGIGDADPADLTLRACIERGVPVEAFEAAARIAVGERKGMGYLLGIVKRRLREAANVEAAPGVKVGPWDATRSGIVTMAAKFGLPAWDEAAFQRGAGEAFPAYTARVRRLVEPAQAVAA